MNGKKIMAAKLAFSAVKDYMAGNTTQALREGFSAFQTLMSTRDGGGGGGGGSQGSLNGGGGGCNQSTVSSQAVQSKITQATAIQFSGCKDDQTSADASIGGTATGAASWALISALNAAASQGRSLTYADVLRDTRANLANKYSQIPQLR